MQDYINNSLQPSLNSIECYCKVSENTVNSKWPYAITVNEVSEGLFTHSFSFSDRGCRFSHIHMFKANVHVSGLTKSFAVIKHHSFVESNDPFVQEERVNVCVGAEILV